MGVIKEDSTYFYHVKIWMKKLMFFLVLIATIFYFIMFFEYSYISTYEGKVHTSKLCLEQIEKAFALYKKDYGFYPSISSGFKALTSKNKQGKCYLIFIPPDPWGNSYKYIFKNNSYQIISCGMDRKIGGKGKNRDIVCILP